MWSAQQSWHLYPHGVTLVHTRLQWNPPFGTVAMDNVTSAAVQNKVHCLDSFGAPSREIFKKKK